MEGFLNVIIIIKPLSCFSTGETLEGLEGLLSSLDLDDFMQTLPGFLLAFTGEGKLIYVSETVAEHLGHSMVRTTGRLAKRGRVTP